MARPPAAVASLAAGLVINSTTAFPAKLYALRPAARPAAFAAFPVKTRAFFETARTIPAPPAAAANSGLPVKP